MFLKWLLQIMILRLPNSDSRMRGGNAGRFIPESIAPVAGRLSTPFLFSFLWVFVLRLSSSSIIYSNNHL